MVARFASKKAEMTGDSAECIRSESERGRERERVREGLRHRVHVRPRLHIPKEHQKDPEESQQVPLLLAAQKMAETDPQNIVMLEVGLPGDTWRYCVERQRLADRSEWFRAMLLGPLSPAPTNPPPTVRLGHVDKRAFDHLLRYLHDEPINFQSVTTARATLDAAHQYLCPQLARLAVKYLEANLSSLNVLEVFQGLSLYAGSIFPDVSKPPGTPTAPPAPENDPGEIAFVCCGLLSVCLSIIDSDPVTVFRQESFEDLTACEVGILAGRDSLKLGRESVLFEALERWAASECRRHGVEPTPCNKRASLADGIWYSVRYPLMTDKEFIEGPMASGVLSSEESAFIVARILGHCQEQEKQQNTTNSPLANLTTTPRAGTSITMLSKTKTPKPGKKEREENKKNRRRECASQGQRACARLGDCLVRVLACVFD